MGSPARVVRAIFRPASVVETENKRLQDETVELIPKQVSGHCKLKHDSQPFKLEKSTKIYSSINNRVPKCKLTIL